MDFNFLVERDLIGVNLTTDERAVLSGNCEMWRSALVKKLHDIEAQFTQRKSESISKGTRNARVEYERWKKTTVISKAEITKRLREINLLKAETNRELDAEVKNRLTDLMDNVLDEIKALRKDIESLSNRCL